MTEVTETESKTPERITANFDDMLKAAKNRDVKSLDLHDPEEASKFMGKDAVRAHEAVGKHAGFNVDDHFETHGSSSVSTKELERAIKQRDFYKSSLETEQKRGGSGKPYDGYLKSANRELDKLTGKLSTGMSDSIEKMNAAIVAAENSRLAQIKELEKERVRALNAIETEKKAGKFTDEVYKEHVSNTKAKFETLRDHIDNVHDDHIELCRDHIEKINTAVETAKDQNGVEIKLKTKPVDVNKNSEAAEKAVGALEKMKVRAVQTGAGALLLLPFLADKLGIIDTGTVDPQTGEKKSSVGVNVSAFAGAATLFHSAIAKLSPEQLAKVAKAM